MDRDWYINECLRQLNDTKFYRRLDTDITSDILVFVTHDILATLATRLPFSRTILQRSNLKQVARLRLYKYVVKISL